MEYRQYHIRPSDLVLEIGSGHDPVLRSDVLCDRYLEDNTEREGRHQIRVDARPFVVADAQALPFRDKVFDYLICQHVLEHADDPEQFIGEMTRVSKRGYVETPSRFHEAIYATKEYHRWLLDYHDGKLWIAPKREEDATRFDGVFTELWRRHPDFRRFHDTSPELLFMFIEWTDRIAYEMLPEASPLFDLSQYQHAVEAAAERAQTQQRVSLARQMYRRGRALAGRMRGQARHQTADRKIDLDALLCCPAPQCHGDLKHEADLYRCGKCSRTYPITGGIPRLLVE